MGFIFRKDGTNLDITDDYNDIRLKGNKLFYLLLLSLVSYVSFCGGGTSFIWIFEFK